MTNGRLFDSFASLPDDLWRRARIVSLVPSLTEALFALGLESRVVGVTDWCVHPRAGVAPLPKLGGTKDPDIPAVIALHPDLVIANREENTRRAVAALLAAGLDVWLTYPRTVADGVAVFEAMAALAPPGHARSAAEAAVEPARERFAAAQAAAAARDPDERVRVFCPIWRDPWMAVARDTYIHDLLMLCGARNPFAERGDRRYPIVSLADVVAAEPEVILLPDEPYAFGPRDAAELARLDVPAAADARIHLLDGTLVSWYGPRIARALPEVGALLGPAAKA